RRRGRVLGLDRVRGRDDVHPRVAERLLGPGGDPERRNRRRRRPWRADPRHHRLGLGAPHPRTADRPHRARADLGQHGGAGRRDLPRRPQRDSSDRLVPGGSAVVLPDDRHRHGDPLPADDELVRRRGSPLIPLADFTLGHALLTVLEIFLFIAWIWVLVTIISDLFADHEVSGWGKAAWTFLLILVPFLGVLIYLIAR